MIIYDIFAVNLSFFIVALLDVGKLDDDIKLSLLERALPVSAVFIALYFIFGIYKSMWEYAGSKELVNLGLATGIGGVVSISIDIIMSYLDFAQAKIENGTFSARFYIFGTLLILTMVCALRVGYRTTRRAVRNFSLRGKMDRIMIVGAGDMGMIIIKELEASNYSKGKPVVAVDDNPLKKGQSIRGVTVKGNCNEIPELAKKYRIDTIIICIPSATDERQAEILHIAVSTGCHLKTAPSLLEMVEDSSSGIRDVNITDLLSRPEVKLDSSVCKYVTDKTVIVTGGGGSIGSELCRQISKYSPAKIIIFDIYENNAFVLKNQLDRFYNGNPEVIIRIGSIRDEERLSEV
ncbi:MAG: polysaccharide biosynthesis protein, partial [Clostridia bacterium]|nr:polysaccharide biosynthesis protein [Clostridia bacterium]